jgi:hypothetical protein
MNYGIDWNSLECANQQTSKQASKQTSKQANKQTNKQANKRSQSSQYFANHREMTRRQYNNNFLFINELRNLITRPKFDVTMRRDLTLAS